jgi:DNA polymerase elongation subunit (family B)
MTNVFTIDIETIPDMNRVPFLPPPKVKYGNTKDPEKRAVMDEEAKKKQIEDMGLNPFTGRICSIAVVNSGKVVEEAVLSKEITEWQLIDRAFSFLRMHGKINYRICTWNGINFDVPFLYKRAMILDRVRKQTGVSKKLFDAMPPMPYYTKKYSVDTHIDIPMILGGWASEARYTGLNDISFSLLGKKKGEIDFKDFPELLQTKEGRSEISEYNCQDALLTDEIMRICKGVLF